MDVRLRAFQGRDFEFVRELYFETLRWAFRPNEVRIITADGMDAGWIQQRQDAGEIFLASIYVTPAMEGKGIGTTVIQDILQKGQWPAG